MRVCKTKWFVRYARCERIVDHSLCEAIERAESGIVDADLGGGVIKQRVHAQGRDARSGAGFLWLAVAEIVKCSCMDLRKMSEKTSMTTNWHLRPIPIQGGFRSIFSQAPQVPCGR